MLRNFYNAFAARVFAIAASLVSGIASLKLYDLYLDPATYGVLVVALVVISYLPLLDGGFRTTTNRSLLAEADWENKLGLIQFAQVFYSVLGVFLAVVAAVVMLGYALAPQAESQSPMLFISLGITGAVMVAVMAQIGLLVGLGAQQWFFLLSGLHSLLMLLGLWIWFEVGLGVWAFPASTGVALALVYPLGLWIIRSRVPGFSPVSFKMDGEFWVRFQQLKGDAWACFRSQSSIFVLFTVDIIIVGAFCSPEVTAAYGLASRIFSIARSFLQSGSEVVWPIVAAGGDRARIIPLLLRSNAWMYGAVMGAACAALNPFLMWFMGEEWLLPETVIYLMTARFLVTGSSSPIAYLLYAFGEFRKVAVLIERELVAALMLGTLLGFYFGVGGVAVGFLAATAFGTFIPIWYMFRDKVARPVWRVSLQVWWRALVGFGISGSVALWAFSLLEFNGDSVVSATVGVICSLASALILSIIRMLLRSSSGVRLRFSDVISSL